MSKNTGWFGELDEDESDRNKSPEEEDAWGKAAYIPRSSYEPPRPKGQSKVVKPPGSAHSKKIEEEEDDADKILDEILGGDEAKEEKEEEKVEEKKEEAKAERHFSVVADILGIVPGQKQQTLDDKKRQAREKLFLGGKSSSSKKVPEREDIVPGAQYDDQNFENPESYPEKDDKPFSKTQGIHGIAQDEENFGIENPINISNSRRGKSKLLKKPQTAGARPGSSGIPQPSMQDPIYQPFPNNAGIGSFPKETKNIYSEVPNKISENIYPSQFQNQQMQNLKRPQSSATYSQPESQPITNSEIKFEELEAQRKKLEEEEKVKKEQEDLQRKIQELSRKVETLEKEKFSLLSEKEQTNLDINNMKEELKNLKILFQNQGETGYKQIEEEKEKHLEYINNLQQTINKEIIEMNAESDRIIQLEKRARERDIANLKKLHEIQKDNIEKDHQKNIETLKKKLEIERGSAQPEMESKTDLIKLTSQIEGLMETPTSIYEEMKEQSKFIEELEKEIKNIRTEKTRMEIERQALEDRERGIIERENQLRAEVEETARISNFQRDAINSQHSERKREENEKRENLILLRRELEMDKAAFEKVVRNFEAKEKDRLLSLQTEKKLLAKQKEEFKITIDESKEHTTQMLEAYNQKREEINKLESDLLHKKQLFENQDQQLKQEYDELQLKIEHYCYERRIFDEEKNHLEQVAVQVEEESRVIYKFKATIENTKTELENLRAEIDSREAQFRSEKAKVDEEKNDLIMRQKAIDTLRIQYLKEHTLQNTMPKFQSTIIPPPKSGFLPAQSLRNSSSVQIPPPKPQPPITSSFRAADFIRDIEKHYGNDRKFYDYLAGEKDTLIRGKNDFGKKASDPLHGLHSSSDKKFGSSFLNRGFNPMEHISESDTKQKLFS